MNLQHTQEFLETNGWIRGEEGKVFVSYFPPPGLDLPDNYYIDVPKSEGRGFHKYMNQLIDILEDIYNGKLIKHTDFNRHNKFVMSSNSMEKEELAKYQITINKTKKNDSH